MWFVGNGIWWCPYSFGFFRCILGNKRLTFYCTYGRGRICFKDIVVINKPRESEVAVVRFWIINQHLPQHISLYLSTTASTSTDQPLPLPSASAVSLCRQPLPSASAICLCCERLPLLSASARQPLPPLSGSASALQPLPPLSGSASALSLRFQPLPSGSSLWVRR